MPRICYFECGVVHCKERVEVAWLGVPDPESGWGAQLGGVCPRHRRLFEQFEFEVNNWRPGDDLRALDLLWPAAAWLPVASLPTSPSNVAGGYFESLAQANEEGRLCPFHGVDKCASSCPDRGPTNAPSEDGP